MNRPAAALLVLSLALSGAVAALPADGSDTDETGEVGVMNASTQLDLAVESSRQSAEASVREHKLAVVRESDESLARYTVERRDELSNHFAKTRYEYRKATTEYVFGDATQREYLATLVSLHRSTAPRVAEYERLRTVESGVDDVSPYGDNLQVALDPLVGSDARAIEAAFLGRGNGTLTVSRRPTLDAAFVTVETEERVFTRVNTDRTSQFRTVSVPQTVAVDVARLYTDDGWVVTDVTTRERLGVHVVHSERVEGRRGTATTVVSGTFDVVVSHSEVVSKQKNATAQTPTVVSVDGVSGFDGDGREVRVVVTRGGERVENATVSVDGRTLGQTDEHGSIDVPLRPSVTREVTVSVAGSTTTHEVSWPSTVNAPQESEDDGKSDGLTSSTGVAWSTDVSGGSESGFTGGL